ncbi:MAG: TIGR03936 family radical SAM-associated protein, partial [Cyanobacteria bacterium]|nr:TIGR03936 family radical SAM-associated protein [Cyanobacteriota bacterium]
ACSTCGVCANFSTWPKFMDPNARKKVLKKVDAKDTDISARLKKPSVGVVRLKIQKRGQLRFMSHLDWLRMIHRAISRSKLPVAFSQGFSPSLKTSFGPALSLLTASEGEYLDIELTEHVPEVSSLLNKFLPEGGKILEEQQLPLHSPGIEESILSLSYTARWTCKEPEKEYTIINRVKFLLEQPTLVVDVETKKSRKSLDLAPYLSDLRVEKNTVSFTLKRRTEETGQPVHIKPDWVLNLIDGSVPWSITRTQLVLKNVLPQAQNAPA